VKIYLHRRALLPIGLPIRAPAECVSRTRTIDDDGSDLDIIEIDFVFQAPTGSVVHGSLVGPVRQGEFSYLPARATRFAMAVLYFGPEDYVVL
jgi:hypothetical protein